MSVHNKVTTETIKSWGFLETGATGSVYYQKGKLQNMELSATVKGNVLPLSAQ